MHYYTEKIAIGGTMCLVFLLMLTLCRTRISRAIKKYWKVLMPVISILKVQINFVQIGCSTGIMIPIAWPEVYLNWLQYLEFFQFDIVAILGLNCISELNTYEASFLATMFTLTLCVFILGGGYVYVSKAKRKALSAARRRRSGGFGGGGSDSSGSGGRGGVAKSHLAHAAGILFDTMDIDFGGTICAVELSAVVRYMQNYHYEGTGRTHRMHRGSQFAGSERAANNKRRARQGTLKSRRTSVNAKSTVLSKQFVVTMQFMISLGAVEDDKTKELHLDKSRFIKAMVDGKLSGTPPMLEWMYHIEEERLQHTYLSTIVQIFLIFHAPLSQKLFFYFNTLAVQERSFMIADYSMEVGTDRYERFIPVVLLVGVVFTLGLPFFILYVLVCKHRHELRTPTVLNRYGFLYLRYAHGSELWEVHEIFRKLVLCGIIVYLPGKNRAAGAILVCVLSCCSLNFFRPQRNGPVFAVAELAFVATTFKYVAAVIINTEQQGTGSTPDEYADMMMGVVVIVADVVVMLAGLGAVFVIMRRSLRVGLLSSSGDETTTGSSKVGQDEAGEDALSTAGFDTDYVMEQSFRRLPGVQVGGRGGGGDGGDGGSGTRPAMHGFNALRTAARMAGHSQVMSRKRLEQTILPRNTISSYPGTVY